MSVDIFSIRGMYYDPVRQEVLLIQTDKSRTHGIWTTPGGKLSPNENPLDGLRRHILAETGIGHPTIDETPFYTEAYTDRAGDRVHLSAHGFTFIDTFTNGRPRGRTLGSSQFSFFSIPYLKRTPHKFTGTTQRIVAHSAFDAWIASHNLIH